MNDLLKSIVENIEQNYTDPVVYAKSMALYLSNKSQAIASNFQDINDLLTMTNSEGQLYDIVSWVASEQSAQQSIIATGDQVAGGAEYVSIIQPYTQEDIEALDLAPVPNDIAEQYRSILDKTQFSEGSVVPVSELLVRMAYERDGIIRPSSELIMDASGNTVALGEVVNYVQNSIGSLQQMSNAFKSLGSQVSLSDKLPTDVVGQLKDGVSQIQAELSTPMTGLLSGLLTGTGSVMDKIKGIGTVLAQSADAALSSSSDSTGRYTGIVDISGYAICNVSIAMGQSDGLKVFKTACQAVKTAVVVVGSLVSKLASLGATLVKRLWNKYVDPLVSNRIITEDVKADTNEFDIPSVSCKFKVSDLLDSNFSIMSPFVATEYHEVIEPATINYIFQNWFGMSQSEVSALITEVLSNQVMLHQKTDFGSLYIRKELYADVEYIFLDIYVTPTSLPDPLYWENDGFDSIFPCLTCSMIDQGSGFVRVNNEWPGAITDPLNLIRVYFGMDESNKVINKFTNANYDIKDIGGLLNGAKCSLIRWNIYMALRNFVQCDTFNFDNLLQNWDGILNFNLYYTQTWSPRDLLWQEDPEGSALRTIIACGLPICVHSRFVDQSQSPFLSDDHDEFGFYIFGDYFHFVSYENYVNIANMFKPTKIHLRDGSLPDSFTGFMGWLSLSTIRRQSYLIPDQAALERYYNSGAILMIRAYSGEAKNYDTSHFFVECCLSPFPSNWYDDAVRAYTRVTGLNLLATFFGGILSNKLPVMKRVYQLRGTIPTFIPYETVTTMDSQRYHIVTANEMIRKAQNLTNIIVSGISILAVAAGAVALKIAIKRSGMTKLTNLASQSEAIRYNSEDVYKAYVGKAEYEFSPNRIPTTADKDKAERGLPSEQIAKDIIKCYNKLTPFDFSEYSSTFPNIQIPTQSDAQRYNDYAAKMKRKSNLLCKVTSMTTGATEDYAGYVDNSKPDDATSVVPDHSDIEVNLNDILLKITG
jgi:hypothetical protein